MPGLSIDSLSGLIGQWTGAKASQRDRPVAPVEAASRAATIGRDEATISIEATLMDHFNLPGPLSKLLGIEARPDGSISLDEIKSAFQQASTKTQADVAQLLDEHGIDRTETVRLRVDRNGHVKVSGGHRESDQIEDLLAEHPELGNRLRGLAAAAGLLEAARRSPAFQADFTADPEASLRNHATLLADAQQWEFAVA